MKKIIVFLLIFISIPLITIRNPWKEKKRWYLEKDQFPKLTKDKKWEFVKHRLFDGKGEEVKKIRGPILFALQRASSKDSLAVKNVLAELKSLLPNKEIGFFTDYTGISVKQSYKKKDRIVKGYKCVDLGRHVITLNFEEVEKWGDHDTLESNIFLKRINRDDNRYLFSFRTKVSGYIRPKFYFGFHKNQSIDELQKIIRLYIIRTITCAKDFHGDRVKQNSTLNAMLNNNKVTTWHNKFTEYDQFLIQKLYSPNLQKEFKNYMYKTYPWRYASYYINIEKTEVIAAWISVLVGIVLFMLGFSVFYQKKYKYNYLSYFVPLFFVVISFDNLIFLYYYLANYRFQYDVSTILIARGYGTLFILLVSVFLMLFDKYCINNKTPLLLKIVLVVCATFLFFSTRFFLIDFFEGNYTVMLYKLNPLFLCFFVLAIGRGVLIYFEDFSASLIKQKDVELSNLKVLNAKAEVRLLQSQINPHFLYNALNSIASLAEEDAAKTEKMALSLSDLFKYTINRQGKKDTTISDEIEMVKNYLEVEQIRFGDRLKYTIDVDSSLYKVHIPMFLIQPLIENAIKHGVSKIEGKGEVNLKIYKNKNTLIIDVKDNGPNFPTGLLSGHGLQTVYDLLLFSYKDKASLENTNITEKKISIKINNII